MCTLWLDFLMRDGSLDLVSAGILKIIYQTFPSEQSSGMLREPCTSQFKYSLQRRLIVTELLSSFWHL